jgi:hypothetical protein
MPPKKPKQVDTIIHQKSKIRVPLYFNESNLEFTASYQGQHFMGSDGVKIKSAVWKAIDKSIEIDWTPIITVYPVEPFNSYQGEHSSYVGLKMKRSYVGYLKTGDRPDEMREMDWSYMETGNNTDISHVQFSHGFSFKGKFEPPCHEGTGISGSFYLPYSESTWLGLEELISRINELRVRLYDMLTTDEGILAISEAGSRGLLLEAPKE